MIACVVVPGFELRAALAPCPGLVLVERDPAAVEEEAEALLRSLEDAGFAVEPLEPGVVVFETVGVERLYGGVEAALRKALASVGPAWDPRAGAGQRRFVALAAARVARAGPGGSVEGEGGGGGGAPPGGGGAAACGGDPPRQSWPRRSPSPRRSRTS